MDIKEGVGMKMTQELDQYFIRYNHQILSLQPITLNHSHLLSFKSIDYSMAQ